MRGKKKKERGRKEGTKEERKGKKEGRKEVLFPKTFKCKV
jgi:hypothetical protein